MCGNTLDWHTGYNLKQTNKAANMDAYTGHKAFDRLVFKEGIMTGNVIGTAQISCYVRAYNKTECNGFTRAPGHLQDYDLNGFIKNFPEQVKNKIRSYAQTNKVVAYKFRHFNGQHEIVHGYIIACPTDSYRQQEILEIIPANNRAASHKILYYCASQLKGDGQVDVAA